MHVMSTPDVEYDKLTLMKSAMKPLTTVILLGVSIVFIGLVISIVVDKLLVTRTPIVVEGTIRGGSEESQPTMVSFVKTPQGAYYLVDKTSKASRKQKAHPKYCPTEGTVHCYLKRRVKINGLQTNRQMNILTFEDGGILAYELEVLSFEVLE